MNLGLTLELISVADWLRIILLYSHLVLCVFALSAVLKTDFALVFGEFSRKKLESTAHNISILLVLLWATGLAIIYIDTGFQPEVLATKSKLVLKLLCVCALTINGLVLHRISFPVLTSNSDQISVGESVLLVITGALSTSHWLLAAFIGMSKPLARLPAQTLFGAYGMFLMTVIITSLFFIPILSRIKINSSIDTA